MTQDKQKFELQDIPEPNLYRNLFSYNELPKVAFDGESVPMAPAEDMRITDTTFRDGQQARPPYTVQQIVDLFELESRLDGGTGSIRQSEFFLYSKKDREAVDRCRSLGREFPEVTGWIRAVKSDFKLVKDMQLPETGILTSCSDYHIFLKLRKTRKQAMEQYLDVVEAALNTGIRPRCHLEDITRADFYGFVVPFVIELNKLGESYGIDVKVRLCDTMGYAVPWAEAELPRSVPKLVHGLIHDAGMRSDLLEWHGHNDFHKVLVNPATAWLYGCAGANCSLLGIGERTGNTPLEGMMVELAQLRGHDAKVDYSVITEIADYYRKELGYKIPHNFPLIGRDFNTTRAGIHADGLIKSQEIYTAFDAEKILNRPIGVAITDKAGAAGIKHWIDTNYGTNLPKDNPQLQTIRAKVEAEYEAGRCTAISDEEMHAWYAEVFQTPAED